ncbi:MAG: nuclease [Gemmatimonadota bacterium]
MATTEPRAPTLLSSTTRPAPDGASRADDGAPRAGVPAAATPARALREHVRAHAENRPGVYRMLGPGRQVLYVGKSIRLRSRLLSYFRADRGEKAAEILGFTERLEWDEHANEFAALLEEFREIRRIRPPFNVQHKKERAVCFLRIPREPAARVLATTRPVDDGSEYFGPVLGAERARSAVRVLVDALELRDCPATTPLRFADQGDLFDTDHQPLCPRADFRRCLAPCAAGCTEREYGARLDVARSFLRGESDAPLDGLQRQLERAVGRWLFEYAAVVVERMEALRGLRVSLLRMERALDSLTGIYRVAGHQGDDRVYLLARGLVRAELPAPRDRVARRALHRRIDRLLAAPPPTPARIGGDGLAEMLLVERWFRRRPGEHRRLEPV